MGGLLKTKTPKLPEPERMPDPEDEASKEAARERRRKAMASGGRASTILEGSNSGAYTNEKLGQ